MTRPNTARLAQLLTAGAVVALAAGFGEHHPDAATAAESRFLTLLLGLTLGALSLSARALAATVGGGLLLALGLCLPAAEGTRAALVGVVLVTSVGWATWCALGRGAKPAWWDFAAVTLAWQCLLRSERLLAVDWSPTTAVWLLALPLAAASAGWWYSQPTDGRRGLVLVAALFCFGPGLGVVPVAALVVAAALRAPEPKGRRRLLAGAAALVAIGWQPAAAPAILVLVAALVLDSRKGLAWLPAIGALAWSLTRLGLGLEAGGGLAWLLVFLPFLFAAPAAARPLAAAALALVVGHDPAATPALLAPAFALAALAVNENPRGARLQAPWSLIVLGSVAAGAGLPWLRHPLSLPAPAIDGLPWWLPAAAVALLATLAMRVPGRLPHWVPTAAAAALVALLAFVPQPQALAVQPVVLTPEKASWAAPTGEASVTRIVIDSFATGSGELPAGTLLMTAEIVGREGQRQRFEMRHDRDTADWAARRLARGDTPPPWLTWHAGDGSLAQRYRTHWELPDGGPYAELRLVRARELPPGVSIAVTGVSAR